jgi:pimeloyl-ACP methyl ester carboxylesterase
MAASAFDASVILLHGLLRSAYSMVLLAHDLASAGYRARNVGYPSRPHDVAGLVERYLGPAIEACDRARPVHVVAHSLGGILIRYYLQSHRLPPGSRIVMLAPPNHGSEVADFLRDWPPYRWLMGAVGQQLGTGPDGIVQALGPIEEEVGVIAATGTLQPWFSRLFDGENDGVVSVESTRLAEMCDFITVDNSHTLLMLDRDVRDQVRHFLAEGRFRH